MSFGELKYKLILGVFLLSIPLLAIYFNGGKALHGILHGFDVDWKTNDNMDIHNLKVNYGVYDPEKKFSPSNGLSFDHYYYRWEQFDPLKFKTDMAYSVQKNRWPLITLEPFLKEGRSVDSLFSDILHGQYDSIIQNVYTSIKEFGKPVMFRWGHEMEKVTGRYPWASKDYVGYVNSYRYVVNKFKPLKPNIFFIWSPIGNIDLYNYWPGPDYVDFTGLSVYSFSEWDNKYYEGRRPFSNMFREKYDLVNVLGKPIMITEFGVDGDDKSQVTWLKNAFESFKDFPNLRSLIYFNAKDSQDAWGKEFSTPDWHINSTVFNRKKAGNE